MYWLALIGPAVPIIGCLYVFYKILNKNIDGVKGDLTKTIDGVKGDLTKNIDGGKSDLTKTIDGVKGDLTKTIDGVKGDLTKTIDGVKGDLTKAIDDVKGDLRTNNKSISDVEKKLSGIDATLKGMKENMTLHVKHYWPPEPPYSSRNVKEE